MAEYKKLDIFKKGSEFFEKYRFDRTYRDEPHNYFIVYDSEEWKPNRSSASPSFEGLISTLIYHYNDKNIGRKSEIRLSGFNNEQEEVLKELISLYNKIENIEEKVKEISDILKLTEEGIEMG